MNIFTLQEEQECWNIIKHFPNHFTTFYASKPCGSVWFSVVSCGFMWFYVVRHGSPRLTIFIMHIWRIYSKFYILFSRFSCHMPSFMIYLHYKGAWINDPISWYQSYEISTTVVPPIEVQKSNFVKIYGRNIFNYSLK